LFVFNAIFSEIDQIVYLDELILVNIVAYGGAFHCPIFENGIDILLDLYGKGFLDLYIETMLQTKSAR
jgi:hypothetical protein